MSSFSEQEKLAALVLVELALEEDLASIGDLTSQFLIAPDLQGEAAFVSRSVGTLAGIPIVQLVIEKVSPKLSLEIIKEDGSTLESGAAFAIMRGPLQQLLTAERTALNFLQRLSGVATMTRKFVDLVAGLPVQILDTRKTTPGWRLLEKYAVKMGHGTNHRIGLYDGMLIKDNHLAGIRASGSQGSSQEETWKEVARRLIDFRKAYSHISVEIEVDTLEQLEFALPLADIILLDNMTLPQLRSAVARRDQVNPKVRLEASGGVNLQTVRGIAETGVDRISIGALTHSAPALDIGLDYLLKDPS